MVERRWLPAHWLDEMVPECLPHPDDFLDRDPRGGIVIRTKDEDWSGLAPEPVKNGEIVNFCWTEHYGYWTVAVGKDGDFKVQDGPLPETATHFGYEEMIGDSPADLVKQMIENHEMGEPPVSFEMFVYAWSEDEPFKLTILESGAAHFEAVPIIGEAGARALIAAERQRQIDGEGWTAEHDDRHEHGELLDAAVYYLHADDDGSSAAPPVGWPWEPQWWKPKDARSNLIRSGALCLAEKDRLTRKGHPHLAHVDHKLELAVSRLARLPA